MAFTNISTMDSDQEPVLLPTVLSKVEIDVSNSTTYGNNFKEIPGAYADNVTNIIGPESPSTTFIMPVSKADGTVGGTYDFQQWEARSRTTEIAPIGPITLAGITIRQFSKIRISAVFRDSGSKRDVERPEPMTQVIYVGYVIKYEFIVNGKEESFLRVTCEDARHLMGKAPVQGVLHYNHLRSVANNDVPVVTYIRDAEIIFNEGGKPNKFYRKLNNSNGAGFETHNAPRFCIVDLNRFIDDEKQPSRHGMYAHDAFVEGPDSDPLTTAIHARKWLPGDAINYMANLFDSYFIRTNPIYTEPAPTLAINKLPPLLFNSATPSSGEVQFTRLGYTLDTAMHKDFFVPRALIGASDKTIATTEAVSALGEYNPTGVYLNHAIDDVIRRVGNYAQAMEYTDSNAVLRIFRTVQGLGELKTLPVGLIGGNGGADGRKNIKIRIPTTKDSTVKPSVSSFNLSVSGKGYHNVYHLKGGPRMIQVTLATVGRVAWEDVRTTQDGKILYTQEHQAYRHQGEGGEVPGYEWLPRTNEPTLVPGWRPDEEAEWLTQSTASTNVSFYPDVFRSWVIPDDLDWVEVWGLDDKVGWQLFFEKDRQWLNRLLTSYYDLTLGVYRSRRVHFQTQIWRAMRGIRVNSDGDTAYGDAEGEPLHGMEDWYMAQPSYDIIEDGRGIGFRLDEAARSNSLYVQENADTGPERSPWSWNGEPPTGDDKDDYSNVRTFEMAMTIAIKGDEELWDYLQLDKVNTAMSISKYGPRMEMFRNGFAHYGEERASHSLIDVAFTAQRETGRDVSMRAEPPVTPAGTGDLSTEPRIYRDDSDELKARCHIMANRYGMVDIEAPLQIPYIDLSLRIGAYIAELDVAGDDNIPIGAIIVGINYDFKLQRTACRLATVR